MRGQFYFTIYISAVESEKVEYNVSNIGDNSLNWRIKWRNEMLK
jgi:hypothetical protein